ncbi:MAG: hypothetical protein Q4C41_00815 [Eggerthellaceae bacterium]|nr:hypothetical protein [Eggerthellaceae bacterium]
MGKRTKLSFLSAGKGDNAASRFTATVEAWVPVAAAYRLGATGGVHGLRASNGQPRVAIQGFETNVLKYGYSSCDNLLHRRDGNAS